MGERERTLRDMVVRQLHVPRKAPEIDAARLRAIGQRFAMHHRQRYLDALAKLDGRKREILAALPMFFHCNHPLLPGYLRDAPAGIWGHVPGGSDIAAIHRFARGFEASLKPARQDIDAICLMGSGGSLGHTADSDIDLWVCCEKRFHASLLPKLRAIEQWSMTHGLAVQGFLVDPAFFRDRRDAIHSPLLLDEFYRSGIHLTGKLPLWWYVSGTGSATYQHSARELFEKRLIAPESVLDFGPVGQPDLAVLCSAGITELRRAVDTPHKSLLKLALIEAYLNQPDRPMLSSHYHTLMREGVSDITRLDTYYMLFEYLASAPFGRPTTFSIVELRELFVRRIVSRGREIPRSSQLLAEIRSWGYDDEGIQVLRHPQRMSLHTTLAEASLTTGLLDKGLQFGRRLGMLSPPIRPDLIAIEQTLERFARPDAAILRPMNPALLPAIHPHLEIRRVRQQWRLVEAGLSLRSADTWAELLLWITHNGIDCQHLQTPTAWFDQAARSWLESTRAPFDLMIFFNPLPDPDDDGARIITAFDDPLSYSGLFVCKARMAWCVTRVDDALSLSTHMGENGILDVLVQALAHRGVVEVAGATCEDSLLVRRVRSLLREGRTKLDADDILEVAIGRDRYAIRRAGGNALSVQTIGRLGASVAPA